MQVGQEIHLERTMDILIEAIEYLHTSVSQSKCRITPYELRNRLSVVAHKVDNFIQADATHQYAVHLLDQIKSGEPTKASTIPRAGHTVEIRTDLLIGVEYGGERMTHDMMTFCGRRMIVHAVGNDEVSYMLERSGGTWTREMFV